MYLFFSPNLSHRMEGDVRIEKTPTEVCLLRFCEGRTVSCLLSGHRKRCWCLSPGNVGRHLNFTGL
jgi:hypothetical protein